MNAASDEFRIQKLIPMPIQDPSYASVSRMSIVDLAGSERHRNTFNSGKLLRSAIMDNGCGEVVLLWLWFRTTT